MMGEVMTTALLGVYFAVLAVLSFYGSHRYVILRLYKKHDGRHDPAPARRWEAAELPVVTVQLPLFNERYVAERLIEAACALDWPRDRLEIQVLDDSTDDTTARCEAVVARLAAEGVDVKLLHREDRSGFKAGALEAGLEQARGEFVAIFDADFVPQASFLREVMDHFTDGGVGMVQARWDHLNREFSLLTQAQAILLDGHFVLEHTARNRSGRLFNFNGTAGVWRRQAIDDAGGWEHDTLTEDLDLSYRSQLAGWRFVFLKDVTVPSEIPVEMNAFKAQQHRWAKGSTQAALKLLPRVFASDLPFAVKLEAFHHMTANMSYLLLVVLALLMPLATLLRIHHGWYETLLVDLPIFLSATFSICVFYWTSQREIGRPAWATLRRIPAVLGLGVGISLNNAKAVAEALLGVSSPFVRTPKYGVGAASPASKSAPGGSSRALAYIKRSTLLVFAELAFGLWFTYAIVRVLMDPSRSVFSLPFLMLFQLGFLYVALMSLAQDLWGWRVTTERP